MTAASASTSGPVTRRRLTRMAKNTDHADNVTSAAASHAPDTAAVAASGAATTTATAIHNRNPTAYQPTSRCRARSDGLPVPRRGCIQRRPTPVPLIAISYTLLPPREQYASEGRELRHES